MAKTRKTIHRATLETRHFTFEAFDATPALARAALLIGLSAHAQQYKLDPLWFEDSLVDVQTAALEIGNAYRSGSRIA